MEIFLVSSGFESIDMIEFVDQLNSYDLFASKMMSMKLINLISVQSIIIHVYDSDDFRSISDNNSKLQDITTP